MFNKEEIKNYIEERKIKAAKIGDPMIYTKIYKRGNLSILSEVRAEYVTAEEIENGTAKETEFETIININDNIYTLKCIRIYVKFSEFVSMFLEGLSKGTSVEEIIKPREGEE